jgi:hypothetical protein
VPLKLPGRPTLSIPAVRDRIVQAALKIVLEPVFEADFLPCSFGFRPGRSAHDALQVLIDECWRGRRRVAGTDIASCFSAIPHEGLMATAGQPSTAPARNQPPAEPIRRPRQTRERSRLTVPGQLVHHRVAICRQWLCLSATPEY